MLYNQNFVNIICFDNTLEKKEPIVSTTTSAISLKYRRDPTGKYYRKMEHRLNHE